MGNQMMFPLIMLLVSKEFFLTRGAENSSHHDITSSLSQWIGEIFEEDSNINTINSLARSALASAMHHRVAMFEHKSDVFEKKLVFCDINFYTHPEDASVTEPIELKSWKPSETRIWTKFLRITLEGNLKWAEESQPFTSYFTTLHFKNFVLNAVQKSNDLNQPKFYFDLSYDKFYVLHHGACVNIKWTSGNLSESQITALNEQIQPVLPTLLREHINHNPEFTKAFEQIYKTYVQPSDITSENPDFLENRHMYYCLIPQIPYFGFNLRNVVIQGLSNIGRFDIHDDDFIFSHSLMIKNIRGSLTLDYSNEEEKPLELNYFIDYLSISINEKTHFVQVEARSYNVNRTNGDSLSYRQAANVMQKIESGVASMLMPTKKAWQSIDMESEIGPVVMANKSEWKSIRESYSDWIPFNREHAPVPPSLIRIISYARGRLMLMGR